ncbi:MAG: hypothetical protein ACP5KN_15890 [Armatimonadota bacterium]
MTVVRSTSGRRVLLLSVAVTLVLPAAFAQDRQPATQATIRADGTLLVDDRPVFPVGIHTEDVDSISRIAEAGFNLVSGTGEWEAAHYEAAAAHDLLILGGHYVWATFASFRTGGGIDLKPSEEAGIQNVLTHGRDQSWRMPLDTLSAFDHLPGVIGWRTNEEPEAKLVEYMEYAYEIFKSNSPGHLVVTLSCDPRWFRAFRNTADVLVFDNYPYRGGAGPKRTVLETYEWTRQGVEAMEGKAVWLMPQLIPPSYWSLDPKDGLSLQQMRLQNYAGLIAGAKGVVMYTYGSFPLVFERDEDGSRAKRPASEEVMSRRWERVSALVRELNELGPVLCDARPTQELDIRWLEPGSLGPGPQMTRELDLYGRKYLLVANVLDVPLAGTVYGINGGNQRAYDASVWLGEGALSVRAERPGEPTLTIAPQGTGVFVLTRRPVTISE